jgi:PPOX class probable F420-dependent enzyme
MTLYPQMPPFTQDELEAFLNDAPVARLCSHNRDGSIHIAPVYFKYDHGALLMGTQATTRKVKNITHDPQITILVDNQAPPWKGVIIYGEAELEYEDAVAKRVQIFERYMPLENARTLATGLAQSYRPVVIRVTPKQVVSYDYSKQGFFQAVFK